MAKTWVKKNIIEPKTRTQWRKWLEKNFQKETEAWVVTPLLSSGKRRIPYNDMVEEALCFGWIDSILHKKDEHHTMQRYTPRKKNSPYSQTNIERLRAMLKKNKVHESILGEAKKTVGKKFVFPADIIAELKKNKEAWKNYQKFSDTYKRIRIAYIDGSRKRPEEFKKRLKNFVSKSAENKLITGYGGVEGHY